ncbi:DUF2156 domain-containing protein [Bacillota bacterium]
MFMFENKITIESRAVIDEYLDSFEYKASGLSFTSLYMWRDINQFSWQPIGDYLCIAGISHLELDKQEAFLFPPLTKTGAYEAEGLRKSILGAKAIFEEKGQKFNIRLLPKHMLGIIETAFPGEFIFLEDRANYDYVYLTKDLIKLSGRKYHAKRNHLNHFLSHYDYEYRPMTSDMAEEAMNFIRQFNMRKEASDYEKGLLLLEENAMEDVLKNLERGGYLSGAIFIGGEMQALSIGGPLGSKTVTVHVEKANTDYRGSYQAINNEFCRHMAPHVKYINREEDMDIMGLREAKLSYRPVKFIEKYFAVFK